MFRVFKSKINEPVLSLVELIKNNPERFKVEVIGTTGSLMVIDKNPEGLRFTVGYVLGGILINGESVNWMTKCELRYIYKEIMPYAKLRSPREKWKAFYCGDNK